MTGVETERDLPSTQVIYFNATINIADPNLRILAPNPLRKRVLILPVSGTGIAIVANSVDTAVSTTAFRLTNAIPIEIFTTDDIWLAAGTVAGVVCWLEESYA